MREEESRLRPKLKNSSGAVRLLGKLSFFTVVLAAPLFAQAPAPAAEITPGDVSVGYSHLRLGFSGKPAVDLNGVDVSGTLNMNPSWGATLDSSYVRGGRDLQSGHSSAVFSAFVGPVFTAAQKHNLRFLIRPLVGMTLVDGSVPVGDVYFRGWESRFSWAVGGGVEYDLSPNYAVRFNADYMRAHFISSNATVQGQNGIRFSTNFVFRLSPRSRNALVESDK
jgi:opacity protein-like surface antigen